SLSLALSAHTTTAPVALNASNDGWPVSGRRRSSRIVPSARRRTRRRYLPSGVGAEPIDVVTSKNSCGSYLAPSATSAGTVACPAAGHTCAMVAGCDGAVRRAIGTRRKAAAAASAVARVSSCRLSESTTTPFLPRQRHDSRTVHCTLVVDG